MKLKILCIPIAKLFPSVYYSNILVTPQLVPISVSFTRDQEFAQALKNHAWSCQNVCDALTFLLDNIFIRFGTKLYRQVVGIPMGTNCASLVADLFCFVVRWTF